MRFKRVPTIYAQSKNKKIIIPLYTQSLHIIVEFKGVFITRTCLHDEWCTNISVLHVLKERGGLVVNASDSGSRGRGVEPHSAQTMLYPWARHIYSPKVLVIPRKRWLRPNMTEKNVYRDVKIQSTNQPSTCSTFTIAKHDGKTE